MKIFEFNFIAPEVPTKIVDSLMGPFDNDDGVQITLNQDITSLAHIMAKINFFPSVGQARKNGWDKPIPSGFTKLQVGRGDKMKVIFILADSPVWHQEMID